MRVSAKYVAMLAVLLLPAPVLAQAVLTHAAGNILYERLSEIRRTLGFALLSPSTNPDPMLRQLENQQKAEAFAAAGAHR